MNEIIVNILAGGMGIRMTGGRIPKQFLKIGKEPIFIKTIRVFERVKSIKKAILVMPSSFVKPAIKEIKKFNLEKFVDVIEGGASRQESSLKALMHIEKEGGCEIVVIHDAVRPFIKESIIEESIEIAKKHGAAEVSVPAIDTLVSSCDGKTIKEKLKRDTIYYTQTPQTFKFNLILNAHKKFIDNFEATDDAMLAMKAGHNVQIVKGCYNNIKITSPKDYALAKLLLRQINI